MKSNNNDGKKYFYGIKPIEFIYINNWCDPLLKYNDNYYNYYDLEDGLYSIYKEEHKDNSSNAFEKWLKTHEDEAINLIEDLNPLDKKEAEKLLPLDLMKLVKLIEKLKED